MKGVGGNNNNHNITIIIKNRGRNWFDEAKETER